MSSLFRSGCGQHRSQTRLVMRIQCSCLPVNIFPSGVVEYFEEADLSSLSLGITFEKASPLADDTRADAWSLGALDTEMASSVGAILQSISTVDDY